jgi:two-component system chemotaxis response regulator CheY
MKILIVEDDFASQKLLEAYLTPYGEVISVDSGEDGLVELEKGWDSDTPFDLICLDIMLPGKDGQEILQEIRKREESKGLTGLKGVKVVMTTALGDSKNIMGAFRNQCEHYLTKPISMSNIKRVLKDLGLLKVS